MESASETVTVVTRHIWVGLDIHLAESKLTHCSLGLQDRLSVSLNRLG